MMTAKEAYEKSLKNIEKVKKSEAKKELEQFQSIIGDIELHIKTAVNGALTDTIYSLNFHHDISEMVIEKVIEYFKELGYVITRLRDVEFDFVLNRFSISWNE